jgi:D-galactose 1-dehydrogenase
VSVIKVGIVGVGKIARDQHIPSIAANADFELVAVASLSEAKVEGAKTYRTIEEMLAGSPELDAVSLCTPPQVRRAAALAAIAAGKHVFLEKPPGATVGEVDDLKADAQAKGVSLLASWHSRYAAGVADAKAWLSTRKVKSAKITWCEDVRRWHPGQAWIWQAGGLGVFDPGINALSILTEIMPSRVFVTGATLETPSNHQAPIAAQVKMQDSFDAPIEARFDWRQTGDQTWDIEVVTDGGTLTLTHGGAKLFIDGKAQLEASDEEYPGLYKQFAKIIRAGVSDADIAPLRLVADSFLVAERVAVEEFHD